MDRGRGHGERKGLSRRSDLVKEIVTQHIKGLGFKTVRDYHDWCIRNGFSTGTNKGQYQLQAERKHALTRNYVIALRESNRPKGFKYYLDLLRNGKKGDLPHFHTTLTEDYSTLRNLDKALGEFSLEVLEYLDDVSRLTELSRTQDQLNIRGVMALVAVRDQWLRDYKTWKPKSHNIDKQFSSFARHLLVKYEMPLFMDSAWTRGIFPMEPYQDWYIHIGKGGNLRTASRLPFPLTKMEAHYFIQAPDNYAIPEALRYGQVLALGGSPRLAQAMRGTQIMLDINFVPRHSLAVSTSNDFCLSVIRFFVANPMLDVAHVHPITDYIWNQKFTCGREFVDHVPVTRPPPQPNFSMHGRTPESLIEQVERWHRLLGKERKGGNQQWEHSTVKDFQLQEGDSHSKNVRFWAIRELLSSAELISEGKSMKHCVASYAGSCASGRSSIWSLTLENEKGFFRCLTIEVANKGLCQIRGYMNRSPTQQEVTVLNKWAQQEGLGLATYLRR